MANIPSTVKKIQVEEVAERQPGSESLFQKIGGSINWLLDNAQGLAIGSIDGTVLSEAQYQAINGVGYILADGRNVAGSAYAAITGNATVPNLTGRYVRMKSHGSGTNPDGDTALGTVQTGNVASHTHPITITNPTFGSINRVAVFNPANVMESGSDQLGATGGVPAVTFSIFPDGFSTGDPQHQRIKWMIRIN